MRAFVTGAMGFIGQHLVRRLRADGYELVVYDRKPPHADQGTVYIQGDVLNPEVLRAAMETTKPDIVYHLAALADVRNALRQPTEQINQNFIATANVLEAMRAADVKRIAFTSSAVVYGNTPLQVFCTYVNGPGYQRQMSEESYCFPQQTSIYGAVKLASESLIAAYCEGHGLTADIFRLVSLVGEGYRHGNLVDFYRKLQADPTRLELLGSPSQKKYYCYVGDFVDAVMLTVNRTHTGADLWNVSHHLPNTIHDSINAVADCLRIHPDIVTNGQPWAGDLPTLVLDCSKLRALGWTPKTSIREGMIRTVRDLMERNL